ncbi:AraC family transcriptional regulator [Paracoccus nototheniae]|uniref:Helix-turn-helix domain-containing protein n=1 Tax=Paracoccus nototheniae TaxID=2489002 RepID=A0ABW4DXY9_9RHOB|nr:AraC family transcriptional regulator [Paracoccus nototheniae]
MSLWDRTDWKGGFPFSPTRLRPYGPGRATATGQAVTAATIPDDGIAPLPWRAGIAPLGRVVVPDALTVRVAPASRRFAPRRASLRLIPLEAFAWGGPADLRGSPALPRTRPDHVLIWVASGRMRLQFPRRDVVLGPGDVRYIPAGTAFTARPLSGAGGHVLMIAPELTADLDPALPRTMIAGCVGAGATAFLVTLRDLVDEAARRPDRAALSCHLNLLSLRLSRLEPERDHCPGTPQSPPDRPLVERFLALAAIEMGTWRTLADLAQDLDTTLTQLDRACHQARGRRAVELLHELRLERAAELLRHTDRPTARIAQDLGYASHTHFTRAFVTATGRTPEAFRTQMRTS